MTCSSFRLLSRHNGPRATLMTMMFQEQHQHRYQMHHKCTITSRLYIKALQEVNHANANAHNENCKPCALYLFSYSFHRLPFLEKKKKKMKDSFKQNQMCFGLNGITVSLTSEWNLPFQATKVWLEASRTNLSLGFIVPSIAAVSFCTADIEHICASAGDVHLLATAVHGSVCVRRPPARDENILSDLSRTAAHPPPLF